MQALGVKFNLISEVFYNLATPQSFTKRWSLPTPVGLKLYTYITCKIGIREAL